MHEISSNIKEIKNNCWMVINKWPKHHFVGVKSQKIFNLNCGTTQTREKKENFEKL